MFTSNMQAKLLSKQILNSKRIIPTGSMIIPVTPCGGFGTRALLDNQEFWTDMISDPVWHWEYAVSSSLQGVRMKIHYLNSIYKVYHVDDFYISGFPPFVSCVCIGCYLIVISFSFLLSLSWGWSTRIKKAITYYIYERKNWTQKKSTSWSPVLEEQHLAYCHTSR